MSPKEMLDLIRKVRNTDETKKAEIAACNAALKLKVKK